MNITDNLTKPLLDQCFNTLKRQIGLQQADDRNKAESVGAAGKSKINTARQAAQSNEPNCRNAEDIAKLEENEKTEDNRRARGVESRSPIRQQAQGPTDASNQ